MWIYLVLLYGVLKGVREICKKKALLTCTSIEVLLIYTAISFLLVCPDAKNAMGMPGIFYLFTALKAFIIFIAWICSFKAIKQLPLSFYGILDLSRVIFSTLLGLIVLNESMSAFNVIGLILVCLGLLMLKFNPLSLFLKDKSSKVSTEVLSISAVLAAFASCLLNSLSGLSDKILMQYINSSQLQFWYMFFLCLYYIIYAIIEKAEVNIVRALKCKWIWLLAILFVIADRALFIANSMEESQITVMTLLKQAGVIVTILAGKFIFKEKNIGYKLFCAGIMIFGIVLGVM